MKSDFKYSMHAAHIPLVPPSSDIHKIKSCLCPTAIELRQKIKGMKLLVDGNRTLYYCNLTEPLITSISL